MTKLMRRRHVAYLHSFRYQSVLCVLNFQKNCLDFPFDSFAFGLLRHLSAVQCHSRITGQSHSATPGTALNIWSVDMTETLQEPVDGSLDKPVLYHTILIRGALPTGMCCHGCATTPWLVAWLGSGLGSSAHLVECIAPCSLGTQTRA